MSSDTAKASAAEANTAKQGWSAVEDYAWKYDVNSMKVFSEDIDTLLVFAGLFSAVLTAFVVPAYGMLQQDDSVQILSRISSKLDSFQIVLPFVNSTASACSCASDPSFSVSTTARWINILWFLSLLFSLASALFGILAKQWIREYLQWNQTIASPRENILVRQLRSEAWVKWKVPAGIAAIPALLEIAVVLFILGLVVLLWTLDFVVAFIITIAAGILLLAAFSVTTLPAFFQHCPYKSPTGWACAFIYDTITRFKRRFTVWILKIRGCKYEDRYFHALAQVRPSFRDWRDRDLDINGKLSAEISGCSDDALLPPHPFAPARNELIRSTAQLKPLVQALAWVRQGSEDMRLSSEVAKCIVTLPNHDLSAAEWEMKSYGTLYALWKLCLEKGYMPGSHLVKSLRKAFNKYTDCRLALGYTVNESRVQNFKIYIPLSDMDEDFPNALRTLDQSETWLLSNLFLADVETYVTNQCWDSMTRNESNPNGVAERIAIHIAILGFLGDRLRELDNNAEATDEICSRLLKTCKSVSTLTDAPYPTCIHAMLLEAACSIGKVCMTEGTRELSISRNPTNPQYYSAWWRDNNNASLDLTIQIFDQNSDYANAGARHRFTVMANFLFPWMRWLKGEALLQRIIEAACISLQNSYPNCGCYYDLPWIRTLLAVADSELELFSAQSLYSLFDVLDKFKFIETSDTNPLKDSDLLDESGKLVAVITGEDVKENYQKLKNRVLTVFNTGGPSSNPAYLSQDDAGPPSGITDGFASGGDREGVINVDDTAHHAEIPSNFVNPGKAAEKGRAEVQAVNGDSVDVITLPFVSVPNNDLTLNASAAGGRAG